MPRPSPKWTRGSSTCSATPRSPTSRARWAPACARSSTSSATPPIGTAHDQGKTSGVIASGIAAELLGAAGRGALGTTTFRPPVHAGLVRRARRAATGARCFDPVRRDRAARPGTSAAARCSRTSASGSGPGTTRGPARTWTAAVLRECARGAHRASALMDASTLGKIDLQGPDAAEFLDRLYTNLMSTPARSGMIRYGVMCGADGMVFDDGTVIRARRGPLPGHHHHRAAPARVLDWMEEWLQTEWPDLRVSADLGDRAVGRRSPSWARAPARCSARRSPRSSTCRNDGVPVHDLARRRRSAAMPGARVPDQLHRRAGLRDQRAGVVRPWPRAGERRGGRRGSRPYGTETMHVLRAEKGYPIVGQDTDGTVTPHDLGMGWAVSKKKPDFIGKRLVRRAPRTAPAGSQAARRRCCRVDPSAAAARRFADRRARRGRAAPAPGARCSATSPPATTAPRSAGPSRSRWSRRAASAVGETLYAPVGGQPGAGDRDRIRVLFDKEGPRRDG